MRFNFKQICVIILAGIGWLTGDSGVVLVAIGMSLMGLWYESDLHDHKRTTPQ